MGGVDHETAAELRDAISAGSPKAPLEKTSDTVVPYWSSHLDAALSEKIVPYPHPAMFVKPEATDEIKRILHLERAGHRIGGR